MPRLFFALWPDDDTRKQLQSAKQYVPHNCGKMVPLENLHITLAFLGQVKEEVTECLETAVNQIRALPFDLQLDTIGWWRKSRILWLAPTVIPVELDLLATRVNDVSIECGITLDGQPFRPHITLARKTIIPLKENQISPVNWQVRNFVLVESVTHQTGAEYRVRRSWSLMS